MSAKTGAKKPQSKKDTESSADESLEVPENGNAASDEATESEASDIRAEGTELESVKADEPESSKAPASGAASPSEKPEAKKSPGFFAALRDFWLSDFAAP